MAYFGNDPGARDAGGSSNLSRRVSLPAGIAGLIVVVLVIGAGAFLLTSRSPDQPREQAKKAPSTIVLTPQQRATGGVVVAPLSTAPLAQVFRAPGEVKANEYTSTVVAPRVTATVVSRSAKLGDRIAVGQKLVTLYSREMAEAQSAYVLAARDLARFEGLTKYVAARELDEVVSKRQEALGRLVSYGLTQSQIKDLAARGLENMTSGQFDLLAAQPGTITKDTFVIGQVVEPGKTLFEIADQNNVWVEAHVSPALAKKIGGDKALVIAGDETRDARVVQVGQTVDEATRTIGVRLQVDNQDFALNAGQFVDVELYATAQPVTSVPTAAVLRTSEGKWVVYSENADGSFSPRPVEIQFASGDQTAITGVAPGTRVATAGAFFIRSEADKASFGEE